MHTYNGEIKRLAQHVFGITAKPKLGPIPNFDEVMPSIHLKQEDRIIVDNSSKERIIWLLPRGLIFMENITEVSDYWWEVSLSYMTYEGKWKYSTTYHPTIREKWEKNLELQFRKLWIPRSDWGDIARAALEFAMEIRDANVKPDLLTRTKQLRESGYQVFYFSSGEPIYLPDIPNEFRQLHRNGKLRDIVAKIEEFRNMDIEYFNFEQSVISLRQNLYICAVEFFGENHPSFTFIKEIVQEYNSNFNEVEIWKWLEKVTNTVETALALENERLSSVKNRGE